MTVVVLISAILALVAQFASFRTNSYTLLCIAGALLWIALLVQVEVPCGSH